MTEYDGYNLQKNYIYIIMLLKIFQLS